MSRAFIERTEHELRPDVERVVATIFLPGQEISLNGESRSAAVLTRVMLMSEDEVDLALKEVYREFGARHDDLDSAFVTHYEAVRHRLSSHDDVTEARALLIGAYFTQEFAVEPAGLFNPSMVPHPDQTGLDEGSTRFVMSVRGVGAGYISSIGFRTGVIGADSDITFDPLAEHLRLPKSMPVTYSRRSFAQQLAEQGAERGDYDFALDSLPPVFSREQLGQAFAVLGEARITRLSATPIIERFRRIAAGHYTVEFPSDTPLDSQILLPRGPAETKGLEDVRFVQVTHSDGSKDYRGTYTAFDGTQVAPHMVRTTDFHRFAVSPLSGPGAKNKGMAFFPRQVRSRYVSLSRADRESNELAWSDDGYHWGTPWLLQVPEQPWELVQLGNCGSPMETQAGWLVLTHGVGPMHQYSIGAILLDLDDPSVVIGHLDEPLVTSIGAEREGFVPNVVYSCGGMIHGDSLVLPYGCSDAFIRIVMIDLPELLLRLTSSERPVRANLSHTWS